jgi:hypothetical protein
MTTIAVKKRKKEYDRLRYEEKKIQGDGAE